MAVAWGLHRFKINGEKVKKQLILFNFVFILGGCANVDRNDVSRQTQQEYVNSVIESNQLI